ncbi:DNA excision repair protein ERCC-4 [Sarotherodon galilaeus]
MGNEASKLTADEQWLEKKCPGAGQISASRWRNPKKTKCPTWEGKCSPSALTQLREALLKEIAETKNLRKKGKCSHELQYFKAWKAEAARREESKKKRQEKKDKKSEKQNLTASLVKPEDETQCSARNMCINPPPYAPPPPTSAATAAASPTSAATAAASPTSAATAAAPPIKHSPISGRTRSHTQHPYVKVQTMLNKLSLKDSPQKEIGDTVDPPATGIYPLVAVANPRFGLIIGPEGQEEQDDRPHIHVFRPGDYTGSNAGGVAHAPGSTDLINDLTNLYERIRVRLAPRADYGKIGEVKQKEAETASDFLDRLRPVFRQHSGLDYEEAPERPYQQQLKNAFLNGLLPPVRAHVEKHWVTMNTGNLADALQYAEHATRVVKKKEKGGVFTVDPETGFIAFAGGYRGKRQGQQRDRGRRRAGFRGERDNRCYICGKEGHFARDCRYKKEDDSGEGQSK